MFNFEETSASSWVIVDASGAQYSSVARRVNPRLTRASKYTRIIHSNYVFHSFVQWLFECLFVTCKVLLLCTCSCVTYHLMDDGNGKVHPRPPHMACA